MVTKGNYLMNFCCNKKKQKILRSELEIVFKIEEMPIFLFPDRNDVLEKKIEIREKKLSETLTLGGERS